MSISSFVNIAFLAALALGARQLYGQTVENVHFDAGTSGAEISGSVTGNGYVDYVLGASGGQTMKVDMATKSDKAIYFNILPPGSDDVAIYNASIDGTTAAVSLPDDGDYKIRVYQMGNAKDSGVTTDYTLSVMIE